MNNEKKKSELPMILGLCALILALLLGIKAIFALLPKAIPQEPWSYSQPVDASGSSAPVDGEDGPNFCPFCGEEMTDTFRWGQFCPFCGEKVER